jgi:hypothetical protein
MIFKALKRMNKKRPMENEKVADGNMVHDESYCNHHKAALLSCLALAFFVD